MEVFPLFIRFIIQTAFTLNNSNNNNKNNKLYYQIKKLNFIYNTIYWDKKGNIYSEWLKI